MFALLEDSDGARLVAMALQNWDENDVYGRRTRYANAQRFRAEAAAFAKELEHWYTHSQ